ncbi:hypothetical protein AS144_06545 [Francisella endosymbiont of Amblyomma maculatum]|nr:hypothetical protein AS144_06545 [Francisella endosymbiont of Amblyomma maculatum]
MQLHQHIPQDHPLENLQLELQIKILSYPAPIRLVNVIELITAKLDDSKTIKPIILTATIA